MTVSQELSDLLGPSEQGRRLIKEVENLELRVINMRQASLRTPRSGVKYTTTNPLLYVRSAEPKK